MQAELNKMKQGSQETVKDFLRCFNAILEFAKTGEMQAKTILVNALTDAAKGHLGNLLVARHATGLHTGDVADVLEEISLEEVQNLLNNANPLRWFTTPTNATNESTAATGNRR